MTAGIVGNVRYASHEGIAEITIACPDPYNIITHEVVAELHAAWARFACSNERVAILSGASEKAFTAGADLRDLPHDFWRAVPGLGVPIDKPVIAATSGLVIGGGLVLVQFADLAIATETTVFSYPEARVGYTGGLIASLAARIPHKLAMELMLLGGSIDARRAYEVGLVNRLVPAGEHLTVARELAARVAANAPLVVATLKRFVADVIPQGPAEAGARARAQIVAIGSTEDAREGIAAFVDKRPPVFTGR